MYEWLVVIHNPGATNEFAIGDSWQITGTLAEAERKTKEIAKEYAGVGEQVKLYRCVEHEFDWSDK